MTSGQKTYSHLAQGQKMPSDYDIVSSRLHYHTHLGLEVNIPFAAWYEKYQKNSPLQCPDWEIFSDPRQMTYASYMKRQSRNQNYLEGLLSSFEKSDEQIFLNEDLRKDWQDLVAPLLYPWHGLQMVAAYLGQLAPSGKITITCAFQAADELRRVQHLAYCLGLWQKTESSFADQRRKIWQDHKLWQPLRALVEKLLVTYSWGEAFVGLNLSLKPHLDHLFLCELPELFQGQGEHFLKNFFASFYEDSLWQQDWSRELVRVICRERAENISAINNILSVWNPQVEDVVKIFAKEYQNRLKSSVETQKIIFGERTARAYADFHDALRTFVASEEFAGREIG